jgi:ubiquinone/menaquinone biosynthesis C-methylase UbiE
MIYSGDRLSANHVWEKALEILGRIRGWKILDAPAGSGSLSLIMESMGAEVYSFDFDNASPGGKRKTVADLNAPLPFRDGSFDAVISIEGIEHVENPAFLFREFFRVIKKGGILILSTPNILNIRSRIKFLMTGALFWFGKKAISDFGHIMPIAHYQIDHFSQEAGFIREKLEVNRKFNAFWPIAFILNKSGSFFRESFNSFELLLGEIIILQMRKE